MKTPLFADTVLNSLIQMGQQFINAFPRVFTAIVIVLVGMIIAKMIAKTLRKLMEKAGIDKIGEKLNEIEMIQKSNIEIKLSQLFSKVLYYVLMLFFLVAAADVLAMPAVSQLVTDIFNFVPNLIVALIVLILGLLMSEAVKNLVYTTLKSLAIPSARIISSFLFYFLLINVFVSALTQAKINIEFLSQNLTVLIGGAVMAFGIGYGLASKDVIANFMASFYSKDKVKLGDMVTIDGVEGEIIDLDRTSLTINTDKSQVILPLSKMTSDKIEIHKG
ncbi:MAG: mechanosensitive ion channel [Saprospiraceae bacterium]|nr:mechanosensitive ion channel [Saprospiraceae bacterium]